MENEASPQPKRQVSSYKWPPDPVPVPTPTELKLRMLTGRNAPYEGKIVATTRGWVSRDSDWHIFAARFLDFAVLTPDHLVFCSTGFFSRQPRRQVLREPVSRLVVVPLGPEPYRKLRIVGDFSRPLLLELRGDEASLAFGQALLDCTRTEPGPAAPSTDANETPDSAVETEQSSEQKPAR